MRRPLLGLCSLFTLLLFSFSLNSQTTLAPGDIAVTGYNADGTDSYMVVMLTPVTAGTIVNFTDNGWTAAGAFRTGEGIHTLTFTSAAPAGTEVQITGSVVTFSNATTGTVATMGSLNFAGGGDQLLVYQGTMAAPVFITALSMQSGAWQADATNTADSALPTGLTDGTNAFALVPEIDNAIYDRSTTDGTPAEVLAAVYNSANWSGNNTTGLTQTPMSYFAPPAVPADLRTLDGTATICPSTSGMVNVTDGDLNDATAWVIFTGSCGGTEIDRNTSGMFLVSPAAATTYFVGGENPDGTIGTCSSFTVTPEDNAPPMVTIPADMTITNCDSSTPENVGMASAMDNCVMPPMIAPWINEIHYDDAGGDANEGVEIAGLAGTNLMGWSIEAYNGNNGAGALYSTTGLSGILADNGNGYGTLSVIINGLQNGGNDGLALIDTMGMVVQFLSYEGVVTAQSGTANGMTSTDIGVSEPSSAGEGTSLQLEGTGSTSADFTWSTTPNLANTFGQTNTGQTFVAPTGGMVTITFSDVITPGNCTSESIIQRTFTATDSSGNQSNGTQTIVIEDNQGPVIIAPADMSVSCLETDFSPANTGGAATAVDPCTGGTASFLPFFNEINYDNTGNPDDNEFIEIAAPSGTDLTGYMVVPYNGSNGNSYNPVTLAEIVPVSPIGVGFVKVPLGGLQNGAPDGVALVDASGTVIEFISYEGTFTANNGPASGMTSTDIGVFEAGGSAAGLSLQLTGEGLVAADFTWSFDVPETDGAINEGQSFATGTPVTVTTSDSDDGVVFTRTFMATDACGNASIATQTITRADLAPRIECRQPTSTCNAPGLCGNDNITLASPFVFDDCGFGNPVTLTTLQPVPSFFPIGTTVITYVATNGTGSSTCEKLVIITDEEAPEVECPSDGVVNIYTQNPNSCNVQFTLNPAVTDNCGITSLTGTGNFNFSPGIYNRPVTATDAAGNFTTCNYEIYVHDTFFPIVTNCPGDLTVQATGELTQVNLPQPSAVDNCGGVEITNDAPEAGFPVGTTTVTFMIKDTYGNWLNCIYDVNIAAPLTLMALNDVEASLEDETAAARVAWNEPAANTSCEICAETAIENYRYLGVFRGHQYFLFEGENTTWANAEIMAEISDAQLVTINTENENRFLQNALNEEFSTVWTGLNVTVDGENTTSQWLTADAVEYVNFAADYVAAENEALGVLQADGTWILAEETAQHAFLIERPCINFEQISPILTETNEETGEVTETLLTCGSDFTEGTYVVTYRATDMCGNEAEINFDVTVEMPTANTCTTGGTESVVFIENILMGEYEMTTGDDAGFGDYTAEEMVLYAVIDENTEEFTPVPFNITAGGNANNEPLFYRIWLDTNHDGDFFDADEMLVETMTATDWNFELPAFEENMDATRMRVMVSKNDYPEVCGEVAAGEAEDYTVSILQTIVRPTGDDDIRGNDGTGAPIGTPESAISYGQLTISPNPATDQVQLTIADFIGQNADLTITNQLGQVVYNQNLTDIQNNRLTLNVRDLTAGIYGVSVLAEGGEMRTVKLIVK